MDPISNSDRLVHLLRQRLVERARLQSGASAPQSNVPRPASDVRALAAVDWTDERPLRRTIVQALLADQLGPQLVNDAQFQQVVTRVSDAIESDPQAARLLTETIAELRRP